MATSNVSRDVVHQINEKLPILIIVPHADLNIPPEVANICTLSESDIIADSDEGAVEIYDLADHVESFITTDVARAFVDLNRAPDDIRTDGVVKTHIIWEVPIYNQALPQELVTKLLDQCYYPYHERLQNVTDNTIRLCVDCHTMAATGPPIGPDPGTERTAECLGDANGTSRHNGWIEVLVRAFRDQQTLQRWLHHPPPQPRPTIVTSRAISRTVLTERPKARSRPSIS